MYRKIAENKPVKLVYTSNHETLPAATWRNDKTGEELYLINELNSVVTLYSKHPVTDKVTVVVGWPYEIALAVSQAVIPPPEKREVDNVTLSELRTRAQEVGLTGIIKKSSKANLIAAINEKLGT